MLVNYNGKIYEKINKTKAIKEYFNGNFIYISGNKTRVGNPWTGMGYPINYTGLNLIDKNNKLNEFNKVLNSWHYYQPSELGRKPIFYMEV